MNIPMKYLHWSMDTISWLRRTVLKFRPLASCNLAVPAGRFFEKWTWLDEEKTSMKTER